MKISSFGNQTVNGNQAFIEFQHHFIQTLSTELDITDYLQDITLFRLFPLN